MQQKKNLVKIECFVQFHRYTELELNLKMLVNCGVDGEKKFHFHSVHQEYYLKVQVAFARPTNSKVICADTLCSKTQLVPL